MTTCGKVTLTQLESHLWESANILRVPVDAADFKSYVFPLLFLKRISDVHDEEHATALKQSDGDDEAASRSSPTPRTRRRANPSAAEVASRRLPEGRAKRGNSTPRARSCG